MQVIMDDPVLLEHLRSAGDLSILIVSDSHGRTDGIHSLLEKTGLPDLILHLGDHQDTLDDLALEMDCPVLGVAGNCDHWQPTGALPDQRLLILANKRVFMTHGHLYHVKTSLSTLAMTAAKPPWRADFIVFGHTHHRLVRQQQTEGRSVWLINPGSAFPGRQGPQGIWLRLSGQKFRMDLLPDLQKA